MWIYRLPNCHPYTERWKISCYKFRPCSLLLKNKLLLIFLRYLIFFIPYYIYSLIKNLILRSYPVVLSKTVSLGFQTNSISLVRERAMEAHTNNTQDHLYYLVYHPVPLSFSNIVSP